MNGKMGVLMELLQELLLIGCLDNLERFKRIVLEMKVGLDSSLLYAGIFSCTQGFLSWFIIVLVLAIEQHVPQSISFIFKPPMPFWSYGCKQPRTMRSAVFLVALAIPLSRFLAFHPYKNYIKCQSNFSPFLVYRSWVHVHNMVVRNNTNWPCWREF